MTPAPGSSCIAIIGAGLVGCATALALTAEGHAVTVFDPDAPGAGTSSGNAGAIVTGSVVPTATPAVLRSLPTYVLDRQSPAVLRWHHALRVLPWLWRFVRAGRQSEVERIAAAMAPLVQNALPAHHQLAAMAGARDRISVKGWLKIYATDAGFAASLPDRRLMTAAGVNFRILGPQELREQEPGLEPSVLRHGVFQPDSGFVRDPRGLAGDWMAAAQRGGARHLRQRVRALRPLAGGGVELLTAEGLQKFQRVVVAAGAWSAGLLRGLGPRVLLEAERGYHLGFAAGSEGFLRGPVVLVERGFVLSPMADGLRLVSGDELAGLVAPPDFRRIRALLPHARSVLPALRDLQPERQWMGHRPSTPDSLPVIGVSAAHPAIVHAYGHGHLGLTLSALTGLLVSDLVAGRSPRVSIAACAPERMA